MKCLSKNQKIPAFKVPRFLLLKRKIAQGCHRRVKNEIFSMCGKIVKNIKNHLPITFFPEVARKAALRSFKNVFD